MGDVCELTGGQYLWWWCPGCDEPHMVDVKRWEWNGSLTAPTLAPSILVRRRAKPVRPEPQTVCHSFVRDGKMQFLSDCTHTLAGKMVQIGEWEVGRG